jgi:hypothetical protein
MTDRRRTSELLAEASDRLATPGALLDRQHLLALGLARRSVDVVFRDLPVFAQAGVRRVYVSSDDLREYLAEHTYDGRTKVRP